MKSEKQFRQHLPFPLRFHYSMILRLQLLTEKSEITLVLQVWPQFCSPKPIFLTFKFWWKQKDLKTIWGYHLRLYCSLNLKPVSSVCLWVNPKCPHTHALKGGQRGAQNGHHLQSLKPQGGVRQCPPPPILKVMTLNPKVLLFYFCICTLP